MHGSERSKSFYRLSKLSHIYVESAAKEFPLAKEILAKLSNATVIEIDSYKQILNRKNQNWRESKEVQKLVLAVKPHGFLNRAGDMIQNSADDRFFYVTPILNCLYDCDYCFLQGKYNSPHAVIFVNSEGFFTAVREELRNGPLSLAPSYETDLFAFEGITGLSKAWIEFARSEPDLTIELRTKSGSYKALESTPPTPNVILSWTLSPSEVIESYEPGTARLPARLEAINRACSDGWRVRICLDPILAVPDWQDIYATFIQQIAPTIPFSKIRDIWIGTFRMNQQFLRNIQRSRDDSAILYYPFVSEQGSMLYPKELRAEMRDLIRDQLRSYIEPSKIIAWEAENALFNATSP